MNLEVSRSFIYHQMSGLSTHSKKQNGDFISSPNVRDLVSRNVLQNRCNDVKSPFQPVQRLATPLKSVAMDIKQIP